MRISVLQQQLHVQQDPQGLFAKEASASPAVPIVTEPADEPTEVATIERTEKPPVDQEAVTDKPRDESWSRLKPTKIGSIFNRLERKTSTNCGLYQIDQVMRPCIGQDYSAPLSYVFDAPCQTEMVIGFRVASRAAQLNVTDVCLNVTVPFWSVEDQYLARKPSTVPLHELHQNKKFSLSALLVAVSAKIVTLLKSSIFCHGKVDTVVRFRECLPSERTGLPANVKEYRVETPTPGGKRDDYSILFRIWATADLVVCACSAEVLLFHSLVAAARRDLSRTYSWFHFAPHVAPYDVGIIVTGGAAKEKVEGVVEKAAPMDEKVVRVSKACRNYLFGLDYLFCRDEKEADELGIPVMVTIRANELDDLVSVFKAHVWVRDAATQKVTRQPLVDLREFLRINL